MAQDIDERTLLELCAEAGHRISRHQLKRWRNRGLIQRPLQEQRAGMRGSRSTYPTQAGEQVVAVAAIIEARRDIDEALVELWWRGLWVDRTKLRASLGARFDGLSRELSAFVAARDGDLGQVVDEAVASMDWRRLSPLLELMRERLGGQRIGLRELREVMWYILHQLLEVDDDGVETGADSVLEASVASATGIDRGKADRIAGWEPWLPAQMSATAFIADLKTSGAFNIMDMGAPVHAASDAELDRARDDARMFADGLAGIGRGLELIAGPDVGGIGSLGALAESAAERRDVIVYALLVLRSVLGNEALDAVEALVAAERERFAAIVSLHQAAPEVCELLRLGPGLLAQALDDPEQTRLRSALETFVAENPGAAGALGISCS